jgi:hypothetical protein
MNYKYLYPVICKNTNYSIPFSDTCSMRFPSLSDLTCTYELVWSKWTLPQTSQNKIYSDSLHSASTSNALKYYIYKIHWHQRIIRFISEFKWRRFQITCLLPFISILHHNQEVDCESPPSPTQPCSRNDEEAPVVWVAGGSEEPCWKTLRSTGHCALHFSLFRGSVRFNFLAACARY